MAKIKRDTITVVLFVLVALIVALSFFVEGSFDDLKYYLGENKILTGAVLFSLVFLATVLAPLTAFPLIPMAAVFIGPLPSAIISVLAWTLGAVVAFLLARHLGRPILAYFVDIKEVERFEKYIPEGNEFIILVLLRMLVPVDVLSYAVGLLSNVRLSTYALATLVGVTPFTFLFTYGGDAFLDENYPTLVVLSISALLVFILTLVVYKKKTNK